jgi:hypothetical protein
MRDLTLDEHTVLAHVVLDPAAWWGTNTADASGGVYANWISIHLVA